MSIKKLKNLFARQKQIDVDDISVKSITLKNSGAALEILDIFEPYLKNGDFNGILQNETKAVIVFIHLCTGLEADTISDIPGEKLITLIDRCFEVNLGFFIQMTAMKNAAQKSKQPPVLKPNSKPQPSKMLQDYIAKTYKGSSIQDTV